MIHLDTQIVVWLFFRQEKPFGPDARRMLRRDSSRVISPLVLVELEILIEIGRIKVRSADDLLHDLSNRLDLTLSHAQMSDVAREACRFAWTRDPFDRLIVANAMADGAKLVTADRRILANFKDAVW